ncbi:tyrosine--tRNA ligase [Selenomonas sp. F0473]|uniref:tyrosine--tRNA ligase n=1 Tax=Selenomonas sp. F0473 TaxID=999423 RepID=UPI00029DF9F8|nr:tyrosine--tRNA ligase [Selenomonas sp. F0473]EKU71658.1 tyrosine-tRNA ligase [Selenomonas sp. F0473]
MHNAIDLLKERGFLAQCTDEETLREALDQGPVTFYVGFDPTADSLHAGHFIALMAMSHLQKAGHRPICLVGGGTGTVGDPSGRTDMRKVMTDETIRYNCECFKKQIARFIDFTDDRAIMVDNGDWLRSLNYIELLRDVGAHFTVNRMLAAESYKQRWEKGLTFLEFNYMIMQAYDFLELNRHYGCRLQMGGDDQWSNIIAGVELCRRKSNQTVFGLTNKLLTKSDGTKMGKTAGGALWLDAKKTSPYEFYQYWRNIDDADIENCLSLLTYLPMDEVRSLSAAEGREINRSKEILAYEATKIVHGAQAADQARNTAQILFSGGTSTDIPQVSCTLGEKLIDVLTRGGVLSSKGEARRLIQQGGLTLNNIRITDEHYVLNSSDFSHGEALLKKGKKKHYKLTCCR